MIKKMYADKNEIKVDDDLRISKYKDYFDAHGKNTGVPITITDEDLLKEIRDIRKHYDIEEEKKLGNVNVINLLNVIDNTIANFYKETK